MSDAEWDAQPNEPSLWFDRFTTYRMLGPTRTVSRAFQIYEGKEQGKHPPSSWYDAREAWNWDNRAVRYDESIIKRREVKIEKKEDEWLEHYSTALRFAYGKLTERIRTIDPAELSAVQAIDRTMAVATELKKLYGLDKGEGGDPVNPVIAFFSQAQMDPEKALAMLDSHIEKMEKKLT
jgi:hypothetical protein